jgi:hypothetical protein
MALECTGSTNESEAQQFLQSIGATDVKVETRETGWWLGSYANDRMRFEKN